MSYFPIEVYAHIFSFVGDLIDKKNALIAFSHAHHNFGKWIGRTKLYPISVVEFGKMFRSNSPFFMNYIKGTNILHGPQCIPVDIFTLMDMCGKRFVLCESLLQKGECHLVCQIHVVNGNVKGVAKIWTMNTNESNIYFKVYFHQNRITKIVNIRTLYSNCYSCELTHITTENNKRIENGPYLCLDNTGKVLVEGSYNKGIRNGRWVEYNNNKIKSITIHRKELCKRFEFDEEENIVSSVEMRSELDGFTMKFIKCGYAIYFDDKKIKKEGYYNHFGVKVGKWVYHKEDRVQECTFRTFKPKNSIYSKYFYDVQ